METCLQSLINNQSNDFQLEIIVVDGMSNDKTVDIVKNYMQQFSFIKLLHNSQNFQKR
jgi:glycosyltransferase involved in cell wall biosynthesis